MLKTLKGKVIAGTVTVGLLSSVGVAFGAASSAGDNFKAWYNGQFQEASTSVGNQSYTYVNGKINGLVTEYNGLKTDASTSINDTRDKSITRVQKEVDKETEKQIKDLNKEKVKIQKYMAAQFDGLSLLANGLINQAGKEATAYATENLTAHTGTVGGDAVSKVSTDLTATTATATAALTKAISDAKSDLKTQLDNETTATVDEIKGMVDAKIVELRATVTKIKNDLVKAQQDLVAAEAKRQLEAAQAELKAIVDGI